jgi:Zn-dependent M16 (insulinase) family peptidase
MYFMRAYQPWFFADDPFLGLEFNKPLGIVKKGTETNLLQETIERYLINNPHALLMVLKPEPGLQARIDAQTAAELKEFKAGLNENQTEKLIQETKALVDYQKKEDPPEALATIPMLALSDIGHDIEWFGIEEKSVGEVPVLFHEEFTNDILYTDLYFDIRVLPQELIPYASLLGSVLGKLNTENYTFGELDNALNINTGGFSSGTTGYLKNRSDENLMPKFVVSSKAVVEKADKLFELSAEILNRSKFNDIERLKELITRQRAMVDSDVKNNGISYAMTRLRSYFSNAGMFSELGGGLDYYWFISDLSENFDEKAEETAAKLAETASRLFAKENLVAAVTCSEKDFDSYAAGLEGLSSTMPEGSGELNQWKFDFAKKNEGLLSSSKVQYVVEGYDFKKLGYEYNGKMRVLNQVLSTDWLQNQVRVIGGAYGGFCGFSSNGNAYFASYRDPNLKETLDIYARMPEYLNNFKADEKAMTRFIIGTISGLDQPRTPSQKGNLAVQNYFEKTTPEELKSEREAVLNTTAEDIKGMSKFVQDILDQDAICVYGNEAKINKNKELFGSVVRLTK